MDAYVKSVRAVANVFVRSQCQTDTLAEHHHYAVWFSKWTELGGAGPFCEVDLSKTPGGRRVLEAGGSCGCGRHQAASTRAAVGMLLEMCTGP